MLSLSKAAQLVAPAAEVDRIFGEMFIEIVQQRRAQITRRERATTIRSQHSGRSTSPPTA